jgi:Siphovirus Gp157
VNAITSAPQKPLHASHAGAATEALRQAIAAAQRPLRDAVAAYKAAHIQLAADADLLDALRATGELVLAAEAIVAAGKQVEATARAALAQTMSDTGCPAVALAGHVVHLGAKPSRVDIEDEQAIPAELLRQPPPPAPDKVAIGKLLRAGATVPGARLIENHEPIAVFRSAHQ